MRNSGIIGAVIWHSDKFRALKTDDARLAYFYLHTNEHGNWTGCYRLPEVYALADLGWKPPKYHAALKALVDVGLIEYDGHDQTVLIANFLRFTRPVSRNHALGMLRELERVPTKRFTEKRFNELEPLAKVFRRSKRRPSDNKNLNKNKNLTELAEPSLLDSESMRLVAPRSKGEGARRKLGSSKHRLKETSDADLAQRLWDDLADRYPEVLRRAARLTGRRRIALEARLRELKGLAGWKAILARIEATPFCLGAGARRWAVSFDWLLDETNLVKLQEGAYDHVHADKRSGITRDDAEDIAATVARARRRG